MTFNDQHLTDTHLIKVTKFTDWLCKYLKFQWVEDVVKDIDFNPIIDDISIPCGREPRTVWEVNKQFQYGLPAAVTILFESGCGAEMFIWINGVEKYSLKEGECRTFQIEHLKTIEVSCNGGNGVCNGMLEIKYKPEEFIQWLSFAEVKCFFSNSEGERQPDCSSIRCKEMKQYGGRDTIQLTLPDWNTVELQRVKLLKKGYVVLMFYVNGHCIYTTKPILFEGIEQVLITAPEYTDIKCEVLECDCQVVETKVEKRQSFEVKFSITMFQRIMAVKDVVVEVEGTYCYPREDSS